MWSYPLPEWNPWPHRACYRHGEGTKELTPLKKCEKFYLWEDFFVWGGVVSAWVWNFVKLHDILVCLVVTWYHDIIFRDVYYWKHIQECTLWSMSRDLAWKIKLSEDEAAAKLPNMNPVMVQWRLKRPTKKEPSNHTSLLGFGYRSTSHRTQVWDSSPGDSTPPQTWTRHMMPKFPAPRHLISAKRSSSRTNADVLRPDLVTIGRLRKWTFCACPLETKHMPLGKVNKSCSLKWQYILTKMFLPTLALVTTSQG